MKERPILFSAPMVRAILEGRKTQTRRIVRPQPDCFMGGPGVTDNQGNQVDRFPCWTRPRDAAVIAISCPYGQPGDRLWVRETWAYNDVVPLVDRPPGDYIYRAALCRGVTRYDARWRSSIHMPRRASRITLEVTSIRVERLQDISEYGARAEGVVAVNDPEGDCWTDGTYRTAFELLWGQINGFDGEPKARAPWASNPWVWVIEFKRISP